jgi:hypothetical protein
MWCLSCKAEAQRAYTRRRIVTEEQRRKDICRSYAGVYLRRGKIERKPCEVCGDEKAQMHHEDYSKPLDVRWFCRKHHLELHKESA